MSEVQRRIVATLNYWGPLQVPEIVTKLRAQDLILTYSAVVTELLALEKLAQVRRSTEVDGSSTYISRVALGSH